MKFTFPIKDTYFISQKFGENPFVYKQFNLKGHNGIDIAAKRGTAVYAPVAGIIVEIVDSKVSDDHTGYGNEVRLLEQTSVKNIFNEHVFGHFLGPKGIQVKKDQIISQGTCLGFVDNTGFSTGDHLHWGVRELIEGGEGKIKYFLNGKQYAIPQYHNGFLGYFDFFPLIEENTPKEIFPVDLRYGQKQSSWREMIWKMKNESYAKRRCILANIPYDERIQNAFVYGYWDADTVFEISMFPLWTQLTKPEYLQKKKPALRLIT